MAVWGNPPRSLPASVPSDTFASAAEADEGQSLIVGPH